MNGPVPTGLFPKSWPNFLPTSGETGESAGWETESRTGAYGELNLSVTVGGSTTVALAWGPMAEEAAWDFKAESTTQSKVTFTASAVKGVPSWNLTTVRRRKVYSSALALTPHFAARPGMSSPGLGSRGTWTRR